ncbi:O-antigen acetylase [Photobacterium aphoticum]|uniref:O-antigen acetylase n=1 Tax=Photobacterium aphoticum TaxID=754436 RepID=A0A090QSF8_9GAMM|nr:O-antigen acetylase [Photobacterium aphoticum]
MTFRQDINALRAIAVLVVVIFHFNPDWLPGGFIGVDVFFVISGFLMTGIIFRGFEKETFRLGAFYLARAIALFQPYLCCALPYCVLAGCIYRRRTTKY